MKHTHSALLLVSGFLLAGCPKGAEPARGGDGTPAAAAAAPPAAATSGSLRLPADKVVATWKGEQLTYGQLLEKRKANFDKLDRKQIMERYQAEQQELETFVVETLVEAAAKAKGQTPEQYFEALPGNEPVTEADIQKFYNEKVAASGQPLAAVKDRIEGYLKAQKGQEIVRKEIDRLRAEAEVKTDLPAPDAAKIKFDLAGRPMKGNPNAKVTMVAFSDFQCPYCSRANEPVEAILAAYPNDVKIYFLHFPLSFHEQALPAAVASQCANQQGKFWAFHDKAFENQRTLTDENYGTWAKELGLDMAKFDACVKDPATTTFVKADMEQGEAAGVRGTPSFYVNGMAYEKGIPTVEAIKDYLN